jgi:polyisoprenoid-binding protein YceI
MQSLADIVAETIILRRRREHNQSQETHFTMIWELDPAHSSVTFSTKHMMVTTVRGTIAIDEASVDFDEEHPERSSVEVRLSAASVDTGQEARDQHLRSADFLDAETYPDLTFRSTGVERADDGSFVLRGDLTIRDVTRPVELEAELHGIVANLQGGRRAAFSASTKINREAWGLTWNVGLETGGWLVGKELKIEIDLALLAAEATRAVEDEAVA